MSRHLKLIAAVAVVLVALSGFSTARKGGSRSSGKSGGCSSSSSSSHSKSGSSYDSVGKDRHDSDSGSYSGSRRYNSTTGTTGSRNGSASNRTATGTVTQCAAQTGSEAKAVVEVRNPKSYTTTYQVKVKFLDAAGSYVDSGEAKVEVGSRDTEPVDVRMANPKRIGDVSECLVESVR
ncbi:hypothetical protein G4Z16_19700 [Streptomyces bathyalis]|uniref:Secreted protein n=1 Tax=Streptomyces bathyalis TaxID=2710756 RepID=A0A7T1T8A9_9ACTN|nr:hypothetical protein [Streptomyces bathyalis]QPP08252.1 hypothetical protein G4Z16_19700 [Streptomyces bathyalis]